MPKGDEPRVLVSVSEAARRIGVSRSTLHKRIRSRSLPTFTVIRRNGAISLPYVELIEIERM